MKITRYTVVFVGVRVCSSVQYIRSACITPHPLPPDNSTCVFAPDSPLYTSSLRDTLSPVDTLVTSCADLGDYWTYLIGLMSLSFVGFVLSAVAIISNCIVPCLEGRYQKQPTV